MVRVGSRGPRGESLHLAALAGRAGGGRKVSAQAKLGGSPHFPVPQRVPVVVLNTSPLEPVPFPGAESWSFSRVGLNTNLFGP